MVAYLGGDRNKHSGLADWGKVVIMVALLTGDRAKHVGFAV